MERIGLNRKMYEKRIYKYLDRLVDQPICAIGRASDMLWLGIGEERSVLDRNGCMVKKSTYALHVQSMFRMVNKERKEILFASSDFYSPNSKILEGKEFDWDIQGNNLFDEKSQIWLKNDGIKYIKEYRINNWGDLLLVLSNGDCLKVFVATSDCTECWRLFKCESDEEHMVVTGNGIFF